MAATIHNPWRNKQTSGEKWAKQVARLEQEIAYVQGLVEWAQGEGYTDVAANHQQYLAKVQAKLDKLNAE